MQFSNLSPMYRCEDGNVVQFAEAAVPNTAALEQGATKFFKALIAIVRSPGMKNQIHHQEIRLYDEHGNVKRRALANVTQDKRRVYWDEIYATQLKAYEEGREGKDVLGTPLEQYTKIDVAMAANLRAAGVHTLEQFRAVPDSQLGGLGHQARELRESIARYLDSLSGNSDLRQQNAEMAKQLAEMQKRLEEMASAQPERKKPGRKPKSQPQAEESAEAA